MSSSPPPSTAPSAPSPPTNSSSSPPPADAPPLTPPPFDPSPPLPPGTPPSPPVPPPPIPAAVPATSPPDQTPASSRSSPNLIIGVAVGVALVVIVVLGLFCFFRNKRKKNSSGTGRRRRDDDDDRPIKNYYPPGLKDGSSETQHQNGHQNAPYPPKHQVISMPPKPPPSHPPKSPIQPMPPPPPALTVMDSSGGSGSNYSGSSSLLPPPSPVLSLGFSKSIFTYEELYLATDGFSDANLLGQGGFGYVHKGILPRGKEVAVKQLKDGSGQGEREFQAEVEIISRVHHKHLVTLVGYCMTGAQRILVYEFVPNNTLEFHLHEKGRPTMDWATRMKIALGSAKGLAYLHEDCHPKIIHRDIKASNILLDFNFEAKVADFGLAKFSFEANTHISTRVMGTFGYLAPEYASSGKLTDKSDVFSFGVMLLELITGRRPVDAVTSYMDDSLVDWARPLLTRAIEEGIYDTLVDPKLQIDYNRDEMERMASCVAACVRHKSRLRPRLSQIVRVLEGAVSLSDLNEGITPGHSTVYSSHGSSDYDTNQHKENMRKFREVIRADQDYASSESSRPASEYGLHPSNSSSDGNVNKRVGTEEK